MTYNSEVDIVKSTRWTATVSWNNETRVFLIEEVSELQPIIEHIRDWNDIEGDIIITLKYNLKEI